MAYTLTVTLIGTDLDFAQVLVEPRLAAMAAVPVQQQGVVTRRGNVAAPDHHPFSRHA